MMTTLTHNKHSTQFTSIIHYKSFNFLVKFLLLLLSLIPFSINITTANPRSIAKDGTSNAQMADVIAVKEGADLDLSCPIVVPYEDMVISWMCDNEPANIRSSRIHITDSGKLRIKSAKVGDSCNYRCETADGFGTVSVIIKVIIVDKRLMEQLAKQNQSAQYSSTLNAGGSASNEFNLSKVPPKTVASSSPTGNMNMDRKISGPFTSREPSSDSFKISEGSTLEDQQEDLEIRVEPEVVNVDKNRSFSLECRTNHAPHMKAPQIVWLKQYTGRKPLSLTDALDQNLVIVDNVYYHSLNWPRSITFSKRSAGANSALLVRQSSFVHSGRYVCFAGYPPYTMSSNLTSIIPPKIANQMNPPLRYKLATATVQVNDLEGETNHRLALETSNEEDWFVDGHQQQQGQHKNILYSIVSNNSWTRNLTFTLLILFVILYVSKLIYNRRTSSAKKRTTNNTTTIANTTSTCRTTARFRAIPNANQSLNPTTMSTLGIKHLRVNHLQQLDNGEGNHQEQQNESCDFSSNRLDSFSSIMGQEHACSPMCSESERQRDGRQYEDEHLYIEIGGDRYKTLGPSPGLPATSDCDNYKVPCNISINNNNNKTME